eukprot:13053921-Alexandrium_andersonii.AAC.1
MDVVNTIMKKVDEDNKQKIEAKSGLENYCYTVREGVAEDVIRNNLERGDMEMIEKAVRGTPEWLENQSPEKHE